MKTPSEYRRAVRAFAGPANAGVRKKLWACDRPEQVRAIANTVALSPRGRAKLEKAAKAFGR